MTCLVCDRPAVVRGYCKRHYDKARRSGMLTRRYEVQYQACQADGCYQRSHAHSLCIKHYFRWLRAKPS